MENHQNNILLQSEQFPVTSINDYPHYYHNKASSQTSNQEILHNHISEINFWQDELMSSILDEKFRDRTKEKDLEAVLQETNELSKKIERITKENNEKEEIINSNNLSREDLISQINNLSSEVEELERELEEENNSNNEACKVLDSFENPVCLAKHVIENFDHTTTVKLVSEVNYYLSFYFQMQSFIPPPMMNNMNNTNTINTNNMNMKQMNYGNYQNNTSNVNNMSNMNMNSSMNQMNNMMSMMNMNFMSNTNSNNSNYIINSNQTTMKNGYKKEENELKTDTNKEEYNENGNSSNTDSKINNINQNTNPMMNQMFNPMMMNPFAFFPSNNMNMMGMMNGYQQGNNKEAQKNN